MAIQNYINKIRNAIYGKDVRESIAAAIEECYEDATTTEPSFTNMEVVYARGTYNTLSDRENAQDAAVAAEAATRQTEDATSRAYADSLNTAREAAEQAIIGSVDTERAARVSADSNLQTQINELVAPTGEAPSAAEVQNARIGANGTTYSSLGEAIRGQVGDLQTWLGDDCFYSQTRAARLMDISVNVSAGDVLYFKPVTWTGASFTAINMFGRKNNQDVSLASVSALGEDGFGVAKESYSTIRIVVATSSVPTSNQTMEVYFRNLSTLSDVSQYTFRNSYDLTRTIKNGFSFNSAVVPAPYNDLNTLPVGTVAAYTGTAAANTSNCPLRSWFIIMSYNQSSTNPASSQQVLTEVNTGVQFRRSYNGTWSEWVSETVPMYVNSTGWHGNYKAYTTFKAGMEAAIKAKGCTLHIDSGTYNVLDEFGSSYLNAYDEENACGCLIGNGITVEFDNAAKVTANYTGSNDLIKQYFSPLNVTGDFTLINATIEVQNVRYCVHEDINTVTTVPSAYKGKYIDCNMVHNGNNLSGWTSNFCIGAGASPNAVTTIIGGRYTANNSRHVPIFWHNYGSTGSANSRVIINRVILGASDHLHFRRSASAGNTVYVDVSGCLFGAAISYADGAPDKFDITEWNNTIRS